MKEKKYVKSGEYVAAVRKLAEKVGGFNKIYPVPRGGYYPAIELAKITECQIVLREIDIDEMTLVIDDLVDSGKTLKEIAQRHPRAFYAAVYSKRDDDFTVSEKGRFQYGEKVAADDWLVFPDEHDGTDIEDNFVRTLQFIGEDVTREGLIETPKRMRRAYEEIFKGYRIDPKSLVKTFVKGSCQEMVILKRCEFFSTCEHHFFPFFGHCSIGYIPNGKVIGVSKLARLLDCFSQRLQIQERMVAQIADFLCEELQPRGVYVVAEGVHFCMTSRGVKKNDASMITSAIRGEFKTDAAMRAEFLKLAGF